MKAQEEIKARLEVAQLYEEMGQLPKAARYYLAAAEIALKAKLFDRGRELLEKVLQLEPDNSQAKTYLAKLDQHLASLGQAPPQKSSGPAASQPAAAAGSGSVTIPTPSLYLRSEQISAILTQVSSAPNPKFFPYTSLPKVDPSAVQEKNRRMEAQREAERAKNRTAVESAFGNSKGNSFGSSEMTGGFLDQVQRSGRSRKKDKEESSEDNSSREGRRRRRSGNLDLQESIRKRLQGG